LVLLFSFLVPFDATVAQKLPFLFIISNFANLISGTACTLWGKKTKITASKTGANRIHAVDFLPFYISNPKGVDEIDSGILSFYEV